MDSQMPSTAKKGMASPRMVSEDALFIRETAINLALRHHGESNGLPDQIVSTANVFLDFLVGPVK